MYMSYVYAHSLYVYYMYIEYNTLIYIYGCYMHRYISIPGRTLASLPPKNITMGCRQGGNRLHNLQVVMEDAKTYWNLKIFEVSDQKHSNTVSWNVFQ